MTLSIILIISGTVFLYLGGEALVRGAESLALRLGITPLVVGLTVVALGTSSPELFVSVNAAVMGLDDVAIANVVGSNICNIALVLGIAAMIHPIHVQSQLMRIDAPIMVACSILMGVFLYNGIISRVEGTILVLGIVAYLIFSVWQAHREKAVVAEEYDDAIKQDNRSVGMNVIFMIGGLIFLGLGADFFVDGAVDVARMFGVEEAIIGLTLIALGTSLPELATTIVASLKNQGDIAVGNAVGSSIFNLLAILGVTAIVHPLSQGAIQWVDVGVMAVLAVMLLPMLYTRRLLSRIEGLLLFLCYVGYIGLLVTRM